MNHSAATFGRKEMKKICKNCKWWTENNKDSYYVKDNQGKLQGDCGNEKFVYTGDGLDNIDSDGLAYWDFESYGGGFRVGCNFGCIHFEKREE